MNIRSMTGYAQVKAHVSDELTLTLSLKSVNHRFLDLHLRMPSDLDPLEMKIRRVLKERLHRGHLEVTFSVERTGGVAFAVNRELVGMSRLETSQKQILNEWTQIVRQIAEKSQSASARSPEPPRPPGPPAKP